MAKTVFAPGSTVTSTFLNAINNPVFVDTPAADGEIEKIKNSALSDAAGQIKQEWTTFRDNLKVSAGSGLSVTYSGGAVTLPSGVILTVSPGTLGSLANNAVNYIFVDQSGTLGTTTTYPVVGLLLAAVTTVSGAVTVVQDLRPRFSVMPIASAIRVFGGTNLTDKSCTNGEVLDQGIYYFKNFTVPAGVSITVSYSCTIYCSGNVDISGTVNVVPMGLSPSQVGVVLNGLATTQDGNASTGLGSKGVAYPWGAQSWGTGGKQGAVTCWASSGNIQGWYGVPGDGGGAFWVEAAGAVSVSGSILAKGADGGRGAIGNSQTPGSIQSGVFAMVGGTGGGSGGLIYLSSLSTVTVTASGTLDVRGGNGSNAVANNNGNNGVALGGLGGGGGYVVCVAPTINTTGSSILLTGGTWGQPAGVGFSITSNIITLTNPNSASGNALGGAFGGNSGSNTYTTTTQVTLAAGGTGKLVIRNFVPNS